MSLVGVWPNMETFKLFRYSSLFWEALSVPLKGKKVDLWLSETTGLSGWKREGMNRSHPLLIRIKAGDPCGVQLLYVDKQLDQLMSSEIVIVLARIRAPSPVFKLLTHRFISRYESPNLLLLGAGVAVSLFSTSIVLNFETCLLFVTLLGVSSLMCKTEIYKL